MLELYQQMSLFGEQELENSVVYRGASLVSRIRLQENVKHLVTSVTYGLKCGESLGKLSQDGLWEKTYGDYSQVNLDGFFEEYSGIFPSWGMMLDGVVIGLPMWERFIPEKELGLSHTTETSEKYGGGDGKPTPHTSGFRPQRVFCNNSEEKETNREKTKWSEDRFFLKCLSGTTATLHSGDKEFIKPLITGNDDGFSEAMDRDKALGNAVCPPQFYLIFKAIADIEIED